MIEKLTEVGIYDRSGNCYGMRQPNTYEIVAKINEIIDYINSKEQGNESQSNS